MASEDLRDAIKSIDPNQLSEISSSVVGQYFIESAADNLSDPEKYIAFRRLQEHYPALANAINGATARLFRHPHGSANLDPESFHAGFLGAYLTLQEFIDREDQALLLEEDRDEEL